MKQITFYCLHFRLVTRCESDASRVLNSSLLFANDANDAKRKALKFYAVEIKLNKSMFAHPNTYHIFVCVFIFN